MSAFDTVSLIVILVLFIAGVIGWIGGPWRWPQSPTGAPEPLISTVQRLDLKDGDLLVIRSPKKLSFDEICGLRDQWKQVAARWPHAAAVVLEHGMDVTVIRP